GAGWVAAGSRGLTFEVTNPSTGEVLATLPDLGEEEVKSAIEAAYVAQKNWAKRTGKERAAVLRKLYDLIVSNVDDLATILTLEMGK
ncbi:aldehyde dehydrogenase family protein, partial [Mesorhizobium sp. M2D.F.Ca.ET.140.01.1.1]